MPARVAKRGQKFRVVEEDGKIVKNDAGTAVDGGGHASRARALRQVRAINIPKSRKR